MITLDEATMRFTASCSHLLDNPTRDRIGWFAGKAIGKLTPHAFGGFDEEEVERVERQLHASIQALNRADGENSLGWGRDHEPMPSMAEPVWLDDVLPEGLRVHAEAIVSHLAARGLSVDSTLVKAIVKAAPPRTYQNLGQYVIAMAPKVRDALVDRQALRDFGRDPGFRG